TTRRPSSSPLFPYTTLFRSCRGRRCRRAPVRRNRAWSVSFTGFGGSVGRRVGCPGDALFDQPAGRGLVEVEPFAGRVQAPRMGRSEEHTSELQSREKLVCRL